ncbi:MAG TPA: D-arabinono-1,4-lactone oxidase [Actinomycetota bacterium]|nr:D-arabinono-1,4-lactone oxidase [Actinomycetota bacterium]
MTGTDTKPWTNWANTHSCKPLAIDSPAGEEQIIAAVRTAYAAGEEVKVVGSGHSFTDIACTQGRMISLAQHNRVLDVDISTGLVTVEAGISLRSLNEELARNGLALQNLGDIAYQSIAGAISTATHGTGARFGGLATQVRGLELITADGANLRCSAEERPEIFTSARVSLGALGVISTVTLQCVPAFNLHAVDFPMKLDDCLTQLDEFIDTNEHFEFWWFPHTDGAYVRTNNRTDAPPAPKSEARRWFDDIFLSNYVFGLSCRIGRKWPSTIPRLNRVVHSALGKVELVDRSDRVFTSPRLVRFAEMEYAIPRALAADALREVRQLIERRGFRVSFIVEVRFVAPDDIPLSTAYDQETAYIAVHMFEGTEYEEYFRAVEQIMDAYGGRPHWGKLHFQTAETLRPRYPEWDRFLTVREECDPERRFSNSYLDRVLGDMPITSMS